MRIDDTCRPDHYRHVIDSFPDDSQCNADCPRPLAGAGFFVRRGIDATGRPDHYRTVIAHTMTHCHLPASRHAGFFHGYSHDRPSASEPRARLGGALSAGGARSVARPPLGPWHPRASVGLSCWRWKRAAVIRRRRRSSVLLRSPACADVLGDGEGPGK
jgi:hypothetical protein